MASGISDPVAIFGTIVAGVTVFVIGQVVLKLFIDPVQQFKRTIGEITHALEYYANVFSNPGVGTVESQHEANRKLRSLSAQLSADLRVIPLYSLTWRLFFLPSPEATVRARQNLIGLSNGVYRDQVGRVAFWNIRKAQAISDALGIAIPAHERISEDLLDELGGLKAPAAKNNE